MEGSPQNRGDSTPDAILSKTNKLFTDDHQEHYSLFFNYLSILNNSYK